MVVINLWWSEKPFSDLADFIKWLFLLVRIKSMQVGFIDLQQVYEGASLWGSQGQSYT